MVREEKKSNGSKLYCEKDCYMHISDISYLHNLSGLLFSKGLNIKWSDFGALLAMYVLDRKVSYLELEKCVIGLTRKSVQHLEVRGFVVMDESSVDEVHGSKTAKTRRLNSIRRTYLYSLTYEGRRLLDCYYSVLGEIVDSFRMYDIEEIFSDIEGILRTGSELRGYKMRDKINWSYRVS